MEDFLSVFGEVIVGLIWEFCKYARRNDFKIIGSRIKPLETRRSGFGPGASGTR